MQETIRLFDEALKKLEKCNQSARDSKKFAKLAAWWSLEAERQCGIVNRYHLMLLNKTQSFIKGK